MSLGLDELTQPELGHHSLTTCTITNPVSLTWSALWLQMALQRLGKPSAGTVLIVKVGMNCAKIWGLLMVFYTFLLVRMHNTTCLMKCHTLSVKTWTPGQVWPLIEHHILKCIPNKNSHGYGIRFVLGLPIPLAVRHDWFRQRFWSKQVANRWINQLWAR